MRNLRRAWKCGNVIIIKKRGFKIDHIKSQEIHITYEVEVYYHSEKGETGQKQVITRVYEHVLSFHFT
jgi:hypothetical protein